MHRKKMSSVSEFNSISDASDITELGDLTELGRLLKKKKKGWPQRKATKVIRVYSLSLIHI